MTRFYLKLEIYGELWRATISIMSMRDKQKIKNIICTMTYKKYGK